MQDIFKFEQTGIDDDGKIQGELRPSGLRPRASDRIQQAGIQLPAEHLWHEGRQYLVRHGRVMDQNWFGNEREVRRRWTQRRRISAPVYRLGRSRRVKSLPRTVPGGCCSYHPPRRHLPWKLPFSKFSSPVSQLRAMRRRMAKYRRHDLCGADSPSSRKTISSARCRPCFRYASVERIVVEQLFCADVPTRM